MAAQNGAAPGRASDISDLFSDKYEPLEVGKMVGRGAAARMAGSDLTPLTHFFTKSSSLSHATSFTGSAVAHSKIRRTNLSQDAAEARRGQTVAAKLGAEKEHPVHEMQFFNIGGAKVYTYYGLDTVRSSEHVVNAGPHVRDTAVGVLLLDKYSIQNRPGDPSNPLTFWPYQVIYTVPQGISFAKCKDVGSAGSDAADKFPLEVTAICAALIALAEVAARMGYRRLFITGDCGYYALAADVYSKKLLCWGNRSWLPHPDGCFSAFRVPRYFVAEQGLEIVLALGTTQLIADRDAAHSLLAQMKGTPKDGKPSIVYGTADLLGWYSGETYDKLKREYDVFLGNTQAGLTYSICMLDVVLRVNEALFEGVFTTRHFHASEGMTQNINDCVKNVADRVVEFNAGSASYLIGMFLGHTAMAQEAKGDNRDPEEYIWDCASELRPIVEQMARDKAGKPHAKDAVVEACKPFFDYVKGLVKDIVRYSTGVLGLTQLTEKQEWRAFIALCGNEDDTKTYKEFQLSIALRVQYVCLSLLSCDEKFGTIPGLVLNPPAGQGLPLGARYVEWYGHFNAHLNCNFLADEKVERGHAIDGKNLFLYDCRYTPGFGLQVANGYTVWTAAKNYLWMSACFLRTIEILQSRGAGPVIIHLECTEIFAFTAFLQDLGVPCIDNPNMLLLASRCTDSPIRFLTFKQDPVHHAHLAVPPTPSALIMAEEKDGTAKVYRDPLVPVRSPTRCAKAYLAQRDHLEDLLQAQKLRWRSLPIAKPCYDHVTLDWGKEGYLTSRPGESLYTASSTLDVDFYVKEAVCPAHKSKLTEASVQYAPRDGREDQLHDEEAFFGGDERLALDHKSR